MKKNMKSLLSLLLALVFVLQFGGFALADDVKVEITGKEALVYELYLPATDPKAEEKLIPVPADKEGELLNGKTYSIVLSHEEPATEPEGEPVVKTTPLTRTPGSVVLNDLLKEDLVITPPEGFVVKQVYLRGDALESNEPKALPLAADKEKTELTLKAEALAVENPETKEKSFDPEALSTFSTVDPQIYALVVVLSPVDPEKELVVTEALDDKAAGTETKVKQGEEYVLAEAPADTAEHKFTGWQVRYESGATLDMKPGERFKPYADCRVEAQWIEIITLTANTPVLKDGSFVPDGCTYSGKLAEGDVVTEVALTVTEKDGKYVSTPSAAVIKNGDTDVTDQYLLNYVASAPAEKQEEISVQTPITITAKAPVTNDDGKTYVANGYELSSGTLNDGDSIADVKIEVKQTEDGKFVAVPSAAQIKNGETDNTANYDISYQQSEAVTPPVSPEKIAITIRSKDRSAEYTGSPILSEEYEITSGALAEGDSIEVKYEGGSTNVTASPVASTIASVVIKDKDGNDVTASKYTVTIDNENAGKVTVTKHTVTITAITGTVSTDGTKTIKASDCKTADGTYVSGYKSQGLLDGHELRGSFVLGSGKETFTTSIDKDAVKIVDTKNGNADVTSNYDIKTVDGKLTINVSAKTDVPVVLAAKDQTWTYNGTARAADQSAYNISGLLDDDVATVTLQIKQGDTVLDSVTNAGTYTIVPVITIKDKDGKAVDSNKYKITVTNATLTVNKFDLTLEAVSASKAYDGKALVNNNVKATALVSGHKFRDKDGVKFTVTDAKGNLVTNGVINVGTYAKKVTEVHIVDAKGNEVTDNYNIKKVDGTLTITQGITSQNDSTNPKTGDNSNSGLFIILLIASAVLLATIVVFIILQNKKKQAAAQEPVYEDPYIEPDEVPEDWQQPEAPADQDPVILPDDWMKK